MNTQIRKTAMAVAIAALMVSPAVMANDRDRDDHEDDVEIEFDKEIELETDIEIEGEVRVRGDFDFDSAAIAIIDGHQKVSDNTGRNDRLTNDASVGDEVAADAEGNIGVNVAAGDNNAQDNAVALSVADASFAFGMADAEIFVNQSGYDNRTRNVGVINTASVGDNAFRNASGNIGLNVASGNNNEQKNALAASVAVTGMAQSSVSSDQVSKDNRVSNTGYFEQRTETVSVSMSGPVQGFTVAVGAGGYEGTSRGQYRGSTSSNLTGTADQIGDVYPDIWSNNSNDDPATGHSGNNFISHMDLDTATQGGSDLNDDGGALAFGVDGTTRGSESGAYGGTEEGDLGFVELGYAALNAALTGSVTNVYDIAVNATNTASLSGNAFNNASGNIGVNIAAGTGNLQANSLAMAVAQPSTGGGEPPGGGGGE